MKHIKILTAFFLLIQTLACKKSNEAKDQPASTEKSMVVMSYNILQDDASRPEGYLWSDRKDRLIALLKKYNPDILCAQEDYYSQGREIMQATGWGKVGVSRNEGTTTGNGEFVAIYYNQERLTPKEWGHFWLSETPDVPSVGWDASVKRICNWALFLDKNTKIEFYVFDTHTDQIGATSRLKSAELIIDKIQAIAKGNPVILAGDMNTTPGTDPIREIKTVLKDSREITETAPKGPAASFNGADGRVPTKIIDYIFVNDKFEVKEYEISDDSENGLYPSDHFPVITKLKLK